MVWVKDIDDLAYYNTPAGVPCYCSPIIKSSDVVLQGTLDFNGTLTSYTANILIYTPDGTTSLGGVTASFRVDYGKNPDGAHFFTAYLLSIPSVFCSHPCFILRFQIKNGNILYFDYFTERYCLKTDCCDTPSSVTILQDAVLPAPFVIGTGPVTPTAPVTGGHSDDCNENYITLETFSDCYNRITGKYYKALNNKQYTNKVLLSGRLKSLPYEIQRTNSLNCRLQQSQITRLYELEGFELFPASQMDAISTYLTDKYIFIEGRRYEISTTTPFEPVQIAGQCNLVYKLKAQLQDCLQKQIFGCGDECSNNQQAFIQPLVQSGSGNFYGEDKQYIGNSIDDLKAYFQTYPDVISVTDLDPSDYDCTFAAGFIVESDGYVPTSYYYNDTSGGNRIFGVNPDTLDVCSIIDSGCKMLTLGAIVNEAYVCAQPVLGAIVNESVSIQDLYMTGYGSWSLISNYTTLSQNTVTLKFDLFNSGLTYDSSDPDATVPIFSGYIGYVSEAGWPSINRQITQAQAPSLEADASVTIQTDGRIYYSGTVTAADLTGSHISATDIIYKL